ncbi:hypothetical protein D9615_004437 [Tricholomella constricta]|uniref:Glucose-methanol-choline oxidoreductase N-terminal domain-containing protein n=1 Tax=Tricholomella constricta TaxID=117010 RepID=A0A8H5HFG1_9AGAR|nr:hypothetical protein D9615_004437 [Tricholomella constricta]
MTRLHVDELEPRLLYVYLEHNVRGAVAESHEICFQFPTTMTLPNLTFWHTLLDRLKLTSRAHLILGSGGFAALALVLRYIYSKERKYVSNLAHVGGTSQYDVIIVGGGTAGCALASRLSEDPSIKVLLLEAGQRAQYGSPEDFDQWATLMNDDSWSWKNFSPYFTKFERYQPHPEYPLVNTNVRGSSGPVRIGYFNTVTATSKAFIKACTVLGIPFTHDFNVASGTLGVSRKTSQVTYIDEHRQRVSSESAYLTKDVLARKNLTVAVNAQVTRVLFKTENGETRAVGVQFANGPTGTRYRAISRKEVILCAGAVQSPQILMLSGVGPAEHLKAHGISVVHNLPGVGSNLVDHPVVDLYFKDKLNRSAKYLQPQTIPDVFKLFSAFAQYFVWGTGGPLATNTEYPNTLSDSTSGPGSPDLELFTTPLAYKEHGRIFFDVHTYALHVYLLRPLSTGSVLLRSSNPWDLPIVNPNYLKAPEDATKLLRGVRLLLKIAQTEPLAAYLDQDFKREDLDHGMHLKSDEELLEIIRERVETVYHPASTCRMAPPEQNGVVDSQLRVYGIKGLRVCDASVYPWIVSGHTAGACYAMAEKLADVLKKSNKTMFKGILPSKRISSSDFTMITTLGDLNGKENLPTPTPQTVKGPKATNKGQGQGLDKKKRGDNKKVKETQDVPTDGPAMNQAFDRLLVSRSYRAMVAPTLMTIQQDDLQIPTTLRPKLIGMDSAVKAAMLKSSQAMALNTPGAVSPPITPRSVALRRVHSTESLDSPRPSKPYLDYDISEPPRPPFAGGQVSAIHGSPTPRKSSAHSRGLSFDAPHMFSRSQVHLPMSASTLDLTSSGKQGKDKFTATKNLTPTKYFSILSGTSSTQLDVEDIKKLRLLLRNETASWSQEFLSLGGYSALLTRLNEILEVEWREEQHDDQVLHELLRCFKALSTSSIGCFALRSSCPTPFVQLVALLYSDKKPGEVATRQLIVDLLLILFELYPASSLPSFGNSANSNLAGRARPRREAWEPDSSPPSSSKLITLPPPHKNLFSLIRALLLTPAPPPSESPAAPISPHAFIESLHLPRIYKTYLQELSDVCRDYFWVFCHPNNTIWVLSETDEGKVEKPRAPGGMTGGVEFEAMGYFTTHMKLINAISTATADLNLPKDHDHSAYRLHTDLFLSGLERIILISRKASATYYPNLHLELARYIDHAVRSGYELPYTVSRLIGAPPTALAKSGSSGRSTPAPPRHTTPAKRGGPMLPSPRKIEPIRFE